MLFARTDDICGAAEFLRPVKNSYYDRDLSKYFQGTMDPKKVGKLMYHNKVNHSCEAVDQVSEIVKFFVHRPDSNRNQGKFLTEAMNCLQQFEEIDKSLGIKPSKTCRNDPSEVNHLFNITEFIHSKSQKK